jgi:hypothetical protein
MGDLYADRRLWRTLYERDFGALYAPVFAKFDHRSDPFDEAFVRSPWPEPARRLWTTCELDDSAVLPPSPTPDRDGVPPPMPLTRAFAMGATWKWIYAAHARTRSVTVASWPSFPPSIAPFVPRDVPSQTCVTYIGAKTTARDVPDGYGAFVLYHPTREFVAWIEGEWRTGTPRGWILVVRPDAVHCYLSDGARLSVETHIGGRHRGWHAPRSAFWSVVDTGVGVVCERRFPESNTALGFRIDYHPDGSSVEYGSALLTNTMGIATARFRSGDSICLSWSTDRVRQINHFDVSPRCPIAALAGKRIIAMRWCWVEFRVPLRSTVEFGCWPLGDTEDARLLRQHIAQGGVGWSSRVQVAVTEGMRNSEDRPFDAGPVLATRTVDASDMYPVLS